MYPILFADRIEFVACDLLNELNRKSMCCDYYLRGSWFDSQLQK